MSQQTTRQNIEQARGRVAWANVSEIRNSGVASLKKEYRSLARGLNSMIQINGLGPTLGFFHAKGKKDISKPHTRILKHLTEWMQGEEVEKGENGKDDKNHKHFVARKNHEILEKEGLLVWIMHPETSSSDYRRATTECLAFGAWLRRFAEGELEGEKDE